MSVENFKSIFNGLERAHGVTFIDKKGADGEKIKGKSFVKRESEVYVNRWLSIKAVCMYTSLSPSTIRRAVYLGALNAARITGKMLFKASEVDRWLNG